MTVEPVGTAERMLLTQTYPALYAHVQRFYAHQMRVLDTQDTEHWAAVFTEDAVFELPALSGPVRGRAGLDDYVRAGATRQRRAGGKLQHWIGKLDVQARADGSLRTRCSALVHATPGGGGPNVLYVCVMEDVLVRVHDEWRIAHRRVTRDDLARAGAAQVEPRHS